MSYIRQIALPSEWADQMTMECQQFQQEAIRLRALLSHYETLHDNWAKDKELWLTERAQLIKDRDDMTEKLRAELVLDDETKTDEINKLVEKLEKEKSRMKTSYSYFNGLSKAHKQKEDEWIAEKTRMSIEFITDRTYYELELKNERDRYQSMIQQKDEEHKASIDRMRRAYEKKLKKLWFIQFYCLHRIVVVVLLVTYRYISLELLIDCLVHKIVVYM